MQTLGMFYFTQPWVSKGLLHSFFNSCFSPEFIHSKNCKRSEQVWCSGQAFIL